MCALSRIDAFVDGAVDLGGVWEVPGVSGGESDPEPAREGGLDLGAERSVGLARELGAGNEEETEFGAGGAGGWGDQLAGSS